MSVRLGYNLPPTARTALVAAQETTLQELLEGTKQYLVPLYQRHFQWGDKQLKQLWLDISELHEARMAGEDITHFIGSLVLAPLPGGVAGGVNAWLVVDGQQRLTTLSLLLAAIRDHVRETAPDDPLWQEIHELYLVNRFKKGEQHIKFVPTQADRASYNAVINHNPDAGGEDAIGQAYRFFRGRIAAADDPDDAEDMNTLKAAVAEGLGLVSISTDLRDNVHRIFQSLNNTGLTLTQGDLLRNYIFMRLPESQEEAYQRLWLPLQKDLSNEEIENLFWIDLAEFAPTAKITDTYSYQQRRLEKLNTAAELEADLQRLLDLARIYRLILRPELETHPGVRHRLQRLHQWQTTTTHPLMLRLLRARAEGHASDEELERALHVIESYLVRRFVVGKPTNGLNRIFRAAVAIITDDEPIDQQVLRWLSGGQRHFTRDAELREAVAANAYFRMGRVANRKIFLRWLEEEFGSKEPVDTSELSIEHVMPQTLSDAWRAELAERYPGDELEEIHERWLHTLGNLTLTGYNSKLSNKEFSWKREELSRSGLRLNASITSHEHWGPAEIEERAGVLADVICSSWVGPSTAQGAVESPAEESPQWARLRELLAVLPAGHWTAYSDVAAAIGSGAKAVGNHLAKHLVPNAHRVLRSDGAISSGFAWLDPAHDRDPRVVLEQEGVTFTAGGKASKSKRIRVEGLLNLLDNEGSEDSEGSEGAEQALFPRQAAD